MAELGEGWVLDVETVANPLGLAMTDEHDFHGLTLG
jgi:hypothetical protein